MIFLKKFLVSNFYFSPQPRTTTIMEMPLHQWSSTFFTYITTKSCQKRWKPSVAYLNLPITDFLFLCYLQQLFICSESANSRLKNTILVTHTVFHLAPLTLLTKKRCCLLQRESGLKGLMPKTILFPCNFQIQPLQFREKNLFDVTFCASDYTTVSLMVLQNAIHLAL